MTMGGVLDLAAPGNRVREPTDPVGTVYLCAGTRPPLGAISKPLSPSLQSSPPPLGPVSSSLLEVGTLSSFFEGIVMDKQTLANAIVMTLATLCILGTVYFFGFLAYRAFLI